MLVHVRSPRPAALRALLPLLVLCAACQLPDQTGQQAPSPEQPQEEPPRIDAIQGMQQVSLTLASVVTLTPGPDAVNVSRDASVEVVFPAAMQVDSLASAFQARIGATPLAGQLSYDASTHRAVFDPAQPLPPATVVVVELARTVCADGSPCQGASWSFTTAAGR